MMCSGNSADKSWEQLWSWAKPTCRAWSATPSNFKLKCDVCAILHADETAVPVNKVTHWLQVLCTPLLTFLSLQAARGKDAIQAIGIIPQFTGWLL
jgi:transposase